LNGTVISTKSELHSGANSVLINPDYLKSSNESLNICRLTRLLETLNGLELIRILPETLKAPVSILFVTLSINFSMLRGSFCESINFDIRLTSLM